MTAAESVTEVGTVDTLLWVVVPYVCLANASSLYWSHSVESRLTLNRPLASS